MGKVIDCGSYVRDVPDTWEDHASYHQYMKMYCGHTKEQAIEYAKKHLGPFPAKVVVNQIEIVPDDDDTEELA